MKVLGKILITLAIVGFILMFAAAATQGFDRELTDIFGYTGFALWGVDALVLGSLFLIALWRDQL